MQIRHIGLALMTMIALGCSSETLAPEPVTLESLAGRYTLMRVEGKPLPATLGVCFIGGCGSVATIISGTLEIGGESQTGWELAISQIGEGVMPRTTTYAGREITIEGNAVLLWLMEPANPAMDKFSATANGSVLVVWTGLWTYEFRRAR